MALVLTGSEYVDLSAHGAALDIRTRPIVVYAETVTTTDDMQPRIVYGHGPGGGSAEYALYFSDAEHRPLWESTGGNYGDASGGVADDGALHRVAAVISGAENAIAIFRDGAFIDSESLSGDTDTANLDNETAIGTLTGAASFIGEISNVAVWDVELTTQNLNDLTDGTIDPGDLPSGLLGWWPLDFDARDISGNERHGTPVGDPDFTEEPPGGATVEGTADISLGALTLTATGKRVVHGSASVTLGGLSVAATGRRTVHGSADVSLGALTVTGTGSRVVHGSADVALGELAVTATGRRTVHGTSTLDLGALTVEATGRRTVYGSASVPLGGIDVTATGTRAVHGSADVDLGGLTLSAVGQVEGSTVGTADITLGALTVTATGKRVVHGTAHVQLGGLNLAGTGVASGATVGQADVTLGGLDITATGHRVVHGQASITLGALTLTAQIEPPTPIVLPPYREQAVAAYTETATGPYRERPVPDHMEAAVPAYRERPVPAYQESAS